MALQAFMPQLQSADEKAQRAALVAISALGDTELCLQLASVLGGPAAFSLLWQIALSETSSEHDPKIAMLAQEKLEHMVAPQTSTLLTVRASEHDPSLPVSDISRRSAGFFVGPEGYAICRLPLVGDRDSLRYEYGGRLVFFIKHIPDIPAPFGLLVMLERLPSRLNKKKSYPYLKLAQPMELGPADEIVLLMPRLDNAWYARPAQITGAVSSREDMFEAKTKDILGDNFAGAAVLNRYGLVAGIVVSAGRSSNIVKFYSVKKITEVLRLGIEELEQRELTIAKATAISRALGGTRTELPHEAANNTASEPFRRVQPWRLKRVSREPRYRPHPKSQPQHNRPPASQERE
jgi:hypothetical protein